MCPCRAGTLSSAPIAVLIGPECVEIVAGSDCACSGSSRRSQEWDICCYCCYFADKALNTTNALEAGHRIGKQAVASHVLPNSRGPSMKLTKATVDTLVLPVGKT